MKTMKLLFGLMIAFSTMFLFDRCAEPGQTAEDEKTTTVMTKTGSTGRNTNDTATGCSCDNGSRHNTPIPEGGKEISVADGRTMIKAFKDKYNNGTMGGFISKVALDSIFCN